MSGIEHAFRCCILSSSSIYLVPPLPAAFNCNKGIICNYCNGIDNIISPNPMRAVAGIMIEPL